VALWKSQRRRSGLFNSEHQYSKAYAEEVLQRLMAQVAEGVPA
jgi:hypothetical protein